MRIQYYFAFIFFLFVHSFAFAAGTDHNFSWSELRVFITSTKLSNAQDGFNNLTSADQVSSLSSLTSYGLEADAHVLPWLKIGSRFRETWTSLAPASSSSTAVLNVRQDSAGLVARIPLVDNDHFVLDVFVEAGLANSEIDIRTTSSGTGAFTQNSSFYQRAGGSVGLGWKAVKFYIEAGQESNNLNNLTYRGTLNTTISSANFNGTYIGGGLIISGMPSWIKPGGVSTK